MVGLRSKKLSCPSGCSFRKYCQTIGNTETESRTTGKAVEELDIKLRTYNSEDPALYDFALFGLGVTKELE